MSDNSILPEEKFMIKDEWERILFEYLISVNCSLFECQKAVLSLRQAKASSLNVENEPMSKVWNSPPLKNVPGSQVDSPKKRMGDGSTFEGKLIECLRLLRSLVGQIRQSQ